MSNTNDLLIQVLKGQQDHAATLAEVKAKLCAHIDSYDDHKASVENRLYDLELLEGELKAVKSTVKTGYKVATTLSAIAAAAVGAWMRIKGR